MKWGGVDRKHCKIQFGTLGGGGLLGAGGLSPASPVPEQEIFTAELGVSPPSQLAPVSGKKPPRHRVEMRWWRWIYSAFSIVTLVEGGGDGGEASSRQVCLIARSGQLKYYEMGFLQNIINPPFSP